MTRSLAVVVADDGSNGPGQTPTMAALRRELGPDDQVVWVVRGESRTRPDLGATPVECLGAPSDSGRGELYGIGLGHVDAAIVAFTDATTIALPGWRDAVTKAFEMGSVCVAGGPVVPPPGLGPAGRAGFLLEYGPHAVAPFRSAPGDLSANNIAYRAEVVRSCSDVAVWKTVVNAKLAQRGVELVVVPEMQVQVTDHYDLRWLVTARARSGRLYGSHAARATRPVTRVARSIVRIALPVVMMRRAVRVARRDPVLGHGLAAAMPALLLASVAWSVGEAWGLLTARAPLGGVM